MFLSINHNAALILLLDFKYFAILTSSTSFSFLNHTLLSHFNLRCVALCSSFVETPYLSEDA